MGKEMSYLFSRPRADVLLCYLSPSMAYSSMINYYIGQISLITSLFFGQSKLPLHPLSFP